MSNFSEYFNYYLLHRPVFMALVRSLELRLYQKHCKLVGRVLDFGCGDGFFLHTLFKFISKAFKSKEIIGLDVNQLKLLEAKRYLPPYSKLLTYSGTKLPFKNEEFDCILANCVFEHLPNLKLNLKELRRVLKKGGKVFTTVMTGKWEDYLLLPKSYWRRKQAHYHLLTVAKWQRLFEEQGFKIIRKVGYLNKNQSRKVELWHFLSVPYLIAYILTGDWTKLGKLYQRLVSQRMIISEKELETNLSMAGAIFFVLQRK